MDKNNMDLWNKVATSDPDMIEKVAYGAFKFSTIDAHSQVQKATEVFGPIGTGWTIINQKYEVIECDKSKPEMNLLGYTAEFHYEYQGVKGMFEISSDIEFFESGKNGMRRNSDVYKKVATDALTKGLSKLGFNADVFLGKFDDNKYIESLHRQKAKQEKSKELNLADESQLDQIGKLAQPLGLVQEAFVSYLKDKFNTSWSRITKDLADKIILDLKAMEPKEKTSQSQVVQAEPEAKPEPVAAPTKKKVVKVPKSVDDYYLDLSEEDQAKVSADKEMAEKVLLNQTARDICNRVYTQAEDKDTCSHKLSKAMKDITGQPTLANNAVLLLKVTKRKLETLVKTLKAMEQ